MPSSNRPLRAAMLSARERSLRISALIRRGERELRRRFLWLAHQDAIAIAVLVVGLAGMFGAGALYLNGLMPAWLAIVISAICASLLHELEHDQIHQLYFQKRPWMESILFALVWLARGNTIHPRYRRIIHFQHHRLSGTENDVEERFITNGMKWSPLRLLALFDQRFAALLQPEVMRLMPQSEYRFFRRLSVFLVFYLVWDLFVLAWLATALAAAVGFTLPFWIPALREVVSAVVVVWVAPNLLRQFSLQFISSSMHYYGDFEGRLIQQTQVLNRWYFLPLQLFCFNFGSTHGIHHFVVNQPFYIRQLLAPLAHAAMRRYGVRFNDLGSFRRANRFGLDLQWNTTR